MKKNLHAVSKSFSLGLLLQIVLCLVFTKANASGLSGTYYIDGTASATHYKNFSSAITDLLNGSRSTAATGCTGTMDAGTPNGPGVTGAVTFIISAATYSEQIEISAISGASGTNTITFQGNGLTGSKADSSKVIITSATGATNNFELYVKGASFLRFKNITFSRTGTVTSSANVIQIGGNGTTGSVSNLFSHCAILGVAATATVTGPTPGATQTCVYVSDQYDSLNIFRNTLVKSDEIGFYFAGASASPYAMRKNLLDSNIINGPLNFGVYAQYEANLRVQNGRIINISNAVVTNTTALYGVYSYGCNAMTVRNVSIGGSANGGFKGASTSATSYGIYLNSVNSTTGLNDTVYTDSIGGFNSNTATGIYFNTPTTWVRGNVINGFTGSGNTAVLSGITMAGAVALSANGGINNNLIENFTAAGATQYGILLNAAASSPVIDSNTIYNLAGGTTSTTSPVYGIYVSGVPTTSTTIKYNNINTFTATSALVYQIGINLAGSGLQGVNVSNNTIDGFTSNSTTLGSLCGIAFTGATGPTSPTVSNNTIYSFSGTGTTAVKAGIYFAQAVSTSATISGNLIGTSSSSVGTGPAYTYPGTGFNGGTNYGIYFANTSNTATITGNIIANLGAGNFCYGVYFNAIPTAPTIGGTSSSLGNVFATFSGATSAGVYFGAGAPSGSVTIEDDTMRNFSGTTNQYGVYFGALAIPSLTVSGCRIINFTGTSATGQYGIEGTGAITFSSTGINNNLIGNFSATTGIQGGVYLTSTSTAPVITNNTIQNFSSASSSNEIGIYLGSTITTSATITGNTIFNFGASTSAIEAGIYLTTPSASTVNISSNTISGLASTSTTVYGIYMGACSAASPNGPTVSSNTIYSLSGTSGTKFCIEFGGAIASGPTMSGNIIGTNSISSAPSYTSLPVTGASAYGIYFASTSANAIIKANYITYLTATTADYGIYFGGAPTNPSIGGTFASFSNVIAYFSGASTTTAGIDFQTGAAVTAVAIQDDTIRNFTGTPTNEYGIFANVALPAASITGNRILNFTGTSGTQYGIDFGTTGNTLPLIHANTIANLMSTAAAQYGMLIGSSSSPLITGNTIQNLNGQGTTTYGIDVTGAASSLLTNIDSNNISFSSSSVPAAGILLLTNTTGRFRVTRNNIYAPNGMQSVASMGAVTAYGAGIILDGNTGVSATPSLVANNMVTIGGSNWNFGIFNAGATYVNYYYNSVYVTSSYVSGSNASSGIQCFGTVAGTINYLNNISYNSGGGYSFSDGSASANLSICNYNDWYASGTNTIYNTSGYTTVAAWNAASGFDAHSISVDPSYNAEPSVGGAANDLHINSVTPTAALVAGTPVASVIAIDYDNQNRSSIKPCMGADEFAAYTTDAGITSVTPPTLPVCSAGTQNVVANIGNSGSTTLTSAVIGWAISTTGPGAGYTIQTPYYQWTGSLAFGATPASVTLGSFSLALNTNYYLKVWTTHLNGAGISGDSDLNHSDDTAYLTIGYSFNGAYTINPSGSGGSNFTTFSAAMAALGNGGLCGPTTFTVAAGTYNEQVTIPAIPGASSTNTVTFNGGTGNAASRILTYASGTASAPYTLRITGQYINVKNLTISSANTSRGWAVDFNTTTTGAGNNDTIANCIISTNGGTASNSNAFVDVLMSASANSSNPLLPPTAAPANFTLLNNQISGGWCGVLLRSNGTITGTNTGSNISIIGNKINTIGQYGIFLDSVNMSSTANLGGYIYNNFIGGGFTSTAASGIQFKVATYWNLYFNSINLDAASTVTTYQSACVSVVEGTGFVTSSEAAGPLAVFSGFNIEDNMLAVTASGGSSIPFSVTSMATGSSSITVPAFLTFNYNNLYNGVDSQLVYENYYEGGSLGSGSLTICGGTCAGNKFVLLTSTNGTNYFGGAQGYNGNSQTTSPGYYSTTNLHTANRCITGTSISGITTDIDGSTRNTPPEIGAAEATSTVTNDIGVVKLTLPATTSSTTVKIKIQNFGSNTITAGTATYSVNGGSPTNINFTSGMLPGGHLNPCDTGTIFFTGGNGYSFPNAQYSVKAWASNPNGSTSSTTTDNNHLNDTLAISGSYPLKGTFTINPLGSGPYNFLSFTSAVSTLATAGVAGSVVFDAARGSYNEQISLPSAVTGMSAVNSVKFQSTPTIVGGHANFDSTGVVLYYNSTSSTANYVLQFNGSQYFSFQHMTIQATNGIFGNVIDLEPYSAYDTLNGDQLIATAAGYTSTQNIINFNTTTFVNNAEFFSFTNNLFQGGNIGINMQWPYVTSLAIFSGNGISFSPSIDVNIQNNTFKDQYAAAIYLYKMANTNISGNIITSTAAYPGFYGIYFATPTSNYGFKISKNKIYGISGGIGMYIYGNSSNSSAVPAIISNNFIQMGSPAYSIYQTYGIWNSSSTKQLYYNNSVNITSGFVTTYYTIPSAAFYGDLSGASNGVNMWNNIFANTGNGTTAGPAMYLDVYTHFTSVNYNDYFVGTGGSNIFYNGATGYSSLAAWQALATHIDSNSQVGDPGFYTSSDLHVTDPNNVLYHKGRTTADVTTDIDGQSRTVPPSIGADEFTEPAGDVGITAMPLPLTDYCPGSQSVKVVVKNFGTATLTSGSVIPIYLSINHSAAISYSWTVPSNLLPNATDTVSIGSAVFPAGTVSIADSIALTGDGNYANDSFTTHLSSTMGGIYTIGGFTGNYGSFSAAVNDLTLRGICSPVTFNVAGGTYVEQVSIPRITGVSSINTITFQAAAGNSSPVVLSYPSLSTGSFNYTLQLYGTNYVTVQGITIQRTGTLAYGTVVGIEADVYNHTCNNDQILNNSIIGVKTTSASLNQSLVYSAQNPLFDSSGVNTNITVKNNYLLYGSAGIYMGGVAAEVSPNNHPVNYQTGADIENNKIDSVSIYGIYANLISGLVIKNDSITNVGTGTTNTAYGLDISNCNNSLSVTLNKVNVVSGGFGLSQTNNTALSSAPGLIANNFISMSSPSSGNTLSGIYTLNNSYQNIYENSVNIYNTNAGYAYNDASTTGGNNNVEDNIFSNGGGGVAVNVANSGYISSINYNDFYTVGSTLGVWAGANEANIGAWNSVASTTFSIYANPHYYSNTNLHSTADSLIGAGIYFSSVTTDIDAQTRQNPPCIGADEFFGNDAGISAVALPAKYCSAGSQSITVTLNNYGGISLTSATIVLYVNGTSTITYAWTGSLAPNTFTTVNIGSALLPTGSVQLVAKTTSANGASPDNNPVNDSTILNYGSGLSGSYTIGGILPNYASFTAALNDLKSRGVCGAVTFNVATGIYNEQLSIPAITGISSTNTITFQSTSGDSVNVDLAYSSSSYSTNNYVVQLNGASYITFKQITIHRSGTGTYANVIDIRGASSNNKFLNNFLVGERTTATGYNQSVVYSGQDNDTNNVFQNNLIRCGSAGFYLNGVSTGSLERATTIENNTIDSSISYGVYASFEDGLVIKNNVISNIGSGTSNTASGVSLISCNNHLTIEDNKISVVSVGYGLSLVSCVAQSSAPGLIANNFIAVANSVTTVVSSGIYFKNNSYQDLYYNSVNIYNTNSANGLYLLATSGGNNKIKDNIFANSGGGQAVIIDNSGYLASMNYNDLYTSGSYLAKWLGTNFSSLSLWKSASGLDANSVSANPVYTSNTDLHVATSALMGGTPISSVLVDIDGNVRGNLHTTMGANEISINNDAGITNVSIPSGHYCSGSSASVTVILKNYGIYALSSATINFTVNGATQITYSWTAITPLPANDSISVNIGSATISGTNLEAYTTLPNAVADLDNFNDSAKATMLFGLSGTYTIGGTTPNYSTFAAAASDLNSRGICGAVLFKVANGTYNEQITLHSVAGTSASNTITFMAASGDSSLVHLTYSATNAYLAYTLHMNNTSFVTFRKISIEATGTTWAIPVGLDSGSDNNNFLHCRIIGVPVTSSDTTNALVYSQITQLSDTGNVFRNNLMQNGSFGFGWGSYFPIVNENNNIIDSNTIDGAAYEAILVMNHDRITITNNTITNVGASGTGWAMDLEYNNGTTVTGNTIQNFNSGSTDNVAILAASIGNSLINSAIGFTITKNKVYASGGLHGDAAFFIENCTGTSGNPCLIANNFISIGGSTQDLGILDAGNQYVQYNYNSVLVSSSNVLATGVYSDLYNSTGATAFENNIAANTGGGYAIRLPYSTTNVSVLDYNDWYITGTKLGNWGGTDESNLAAWKTASSLDVHSISADPLFTSSSDLHANACALKNRGTALSSVTSDIDSRSRGTMPDIGANEITGIAGQWTGFAGTDWNSGMNWCDDSVPSCSGGQNVHIPIAAVTGATTNYPVVNSTGNTVHNITIDSGASFTTQTGSELDICGNFVNNGTFTATGGIIKLTGGTQNVAGVNFYDLKLNASGTKTLTGNAYVRDSLVCNTGYLSTGSNIVTLDSAAWLKEDLTGGSQVWGALTTQRYIPGNNTRYHFANIGADIQLGNTAGIITVTRNTGSNAICTSLVTGYSGIERNFVITPTTGQGALHGRIWLYYSDAELNGISTSNFMMFRKGGAHWDYIASTTHNPVTVNTSLHFITRDDIDSFSQWTIGSSLTPLPVKMLNFTAVLQDPQTARLDWVTASELNNDHFIVERSLDGVNFDEVGTVKGNGTTGDEHTYTYLDKHIDLLLSKTIYYRLKQVDINGLVIDPGTGVREVILSQIVKSGETKVWYNREETRMYVNIDRTSQMNASILITDISGKILASQNIMTNNGITQLTLNMENFAKGIYTITISDNTGTYTSKVMKY